MTKSRSRRLIVAISLITCWLGGLAPGTALAGEKSIVRSPDPARDKYIVIFDSAIVPKRDVPKEVEGLARAHGAKVRFVYESVVRGFSAQMSETVAEAILRNPKVKRVEEVSHTYLSSAQYLPTSDLLWHLDRIDQKMPISSGDDAFFFCERAGNVVAYVVDSGINRDHSEFLTSSGTSRVVNGVNFASDTWSRPGDGGTDYGTLPCGGWTDAWPNSYFGGHGTSIASLIGGNTYGAAKNITMVPIKVHPCFQETSSFTDEMIAGLNWIASDLNPRRTYRPAVVNISMYAWTTEPDVAALEAAVRYLSADQFDSHGNLAWTAIPVVVTATNFNEDPYEDRPGGAVYTPARLAFSNTGRVPGEPRVISVGGMAANETRWSCPETSEPCGSQLTRPNLTVTDPGSNYGSTVDIYAPAHQIESAHISGASGVRTRPEMRSGTSFATPIVTGIVARILQVHGAITPRGVYDKLVADAELKTFEPTEGNKPMIYRAGYSWCWLEYN